MKNTCWIDKTWKQNPRNRKNYIENPNRGGSYGEKNVGIRDILSDKLKLELLKVNY